MVARTFVHTHVHSDYSLLDGAAKVEDLVEAAARFEQPALALTDHGSLSGAIEFYKACKAKGVKPLLGLEAYLAPRSRRDREKNPVAAHHVILIAQDLVGWRNLMTLSSASYLEGFYYVPRVDKELLARHHQGLIVQSACLSGEPSYYARHDDLTRARQAAAEMQAIFGDRYYLELQRNGCEGQEKVNQALLGISRELGIPTVATNDIHYVGEGDAPAHEVHMCIGMGKTLADGKRLRQESLLCFRAAEPMYTLFGDLEASARATVDIADRVNLDLPLGETHLPAFTPPGGVTPEAYFLRLTREGAERRYGKPLPPAVAERLAYEQGVIQQMGFVSYFLITWDFIRYAKENGIPVGPGRGSGAGSIVAYALGITNVDPLAHDLLFERFLNPQRISMPDLDIDFCKDGRERVIRYVQEKYGGEQYVSQIITFGTMAARAVIRDVGRVMGVPLPEVDALAKKVPHGPKVSLSGALQSDPDLRSEVEGNGTYKELMDVALKLEGLNRNASKHAAGVVISDRPLRELVPLAKVGDDVTTQFTMDVLEDVGLLKMDFLGLRTLTILAKTLENIARGGATPPDLDRLPADDAATFAMLAQGDALGVFQLESSGMRELLRQIRPDRFSELSDIVALYRPGPMGSGMMDMYIERKNGRQAVEYPHPSLEPILKETLGVVVYQEQVMRVANILAGFDLAEADNLRKAMGKKKPELLAKFRAKFVEGCVARGMAEPHASHIWDQLEHFAGYGFNKSHTVAYAVLTWQTAFLKCHFPREFMAALLTCEMADMDKVTEYVEEARRMGIAVLPPDVSRSEADFAVEGRDIRFGLAAIKGVGRAAAEAIVAGRAQGAYLSIFDLCERIDLHTANRAVLEALARAGAFDAAGVSRARTTAAIERAMALGAAMASDRASGQMGLFGAEASRGAEPDYPQVAEWSETEKMAREREAIGYYATDHPLARHERTLRLFAPATTVSLPEVPEGQRSRDKVRLGGMILAPRVTIVKSGPNEGRKMAFFTLEDFAGTLECVLFSKGYAAEGHHVVADRVVIVEGRIDHTREKPSLQVDMIVPVEDAPRMLARGLLLRLAPQGAEALPALKQVLGRWPGPLPVVLEFQPEPGFVARVRAGQGWGVAAEAGLLEAVAAAPGVAAAEFLSRDP
ncbi:MAG: DNA polymerase III subunit alpha [Planctomycetia bacterium]